VVGYVAAVMYRARQGSVDPADTAQTESSGGKHDLTDDDKQQLLTIARETIERYLLDGTIKPYDVQGRLAEPGRAFVTIRKNGELRGCIGRTQAVDPLYKTVSTCALQAAFADSRFSPLTLTEYAHGITIQIDVLTPPENVKTMDDIRVGRDGLIVKLNGKEGVLLPQVAVEQQWSPEEFLRQTCIKAGLQPEDYKDKNAVVMKFRAVIFGDDQ
jgi:AmmeMemoRadiSam system protein A